LETANISSSESETFLFFGAVFLGAFLGLLSCIFDLKRVVFFRASAMLQKEKKKCDYIRP
jgi:hypothetical protein